jgi:hypothetical protein
MAERYVTQTVYVRGGQTVDRGRFLIPAESVTTLTSIAIHLTGFFFYQPSSAKKISPR